MIPPGRELEISSGADLRVQTPALVSHRRERGDVDLAPHRVTPVESRLRAPEHVDRDNVGYVEIVVVLVQVWYVVDTESDSGLVHSRSQPSHVDSGGYPRAIIGNIEIRDHIGNPFYRYHVELIKLRAGEKGGGHGLLAENRALLYGRDAELLERHGGQRVGRGRRRPGGICCRHYRQKSNYWVQ